MHCLIFGYGYMGKIRYQVLRKHPAVRKITVVDPGLDPTAEGLEGVLLKPGEPIPWETCTAAFICTPNNVTADLCVEALERCGRVFCEKPPGRNWDDFCRIAEAAAPTPGHTLVFCFNHRLHPSVSAANALLADGKLGEVLYVKGAYGKSGGIRHRHSWRS